MVTMKSHNWTPIDDLPAGWEGLVDGSVEAMVHALRDQEDELRHRGVFDVFLGRLHREFAIETGAIEDMYRISQGATRTLIERGLDAALISHDDTDEPPGTVIAKILDQQTAIEGVYQFVSSQRPLSKSYIRALHQVVTAHQQTYNGRDTLGQQVNPPLPHGRWKLLPNNVEGPNGFYFQFCPPEQVDSEMERLLALHEEHVKAEVNPLVEAAWLHHRFSLIHPFTDGNGRIARLLASAVLLKERWLPLVVRRHDKAEYVAALRAADDGNLKPLVDLFGDLQRAVVRQALSASEATLGESARIEAILSSVETELACRHDRRESDRHAHAARSLDALQTATLRRLDELAEQLKPVLLAAMAGYTVRAHGATSDRATAGDYRHQIKDCANRLGYQANLAQFRAWAALSIATDVRTELIVSLHELGPSDSGVLAACAMLNTLQEVGGGAAAPGEATPLSDAPFEFASAEAPDNVAHRFNQWLERCLLLGMKKWKEEVI